eukprot:15437044-Alexandrium_andersonii.AAC.1
MLTQPFVIPPGVRAPQHCQLSWLYRCCESLAIMRGFASGLPRGSLARLWGPLWTVLWVASWVPSRRSAFFGNLSGSPMVGLAGRPARSGSPTG